MTHPKLFMAVAIAAIFVASLPPDASAQTQKSHRHKAVPNNTFEIKRPPLTVNARSFLNPGPIVPVGSMSRYVTQSTVFGRTTDEYYAKPQFGTEVLPGPLDVPGRPQPVLQFETPGAPY
ncbi:MAG TPA: hypothetical protein VME69_11285 [Methylocella sp.]|nr:hypothetical protein [Methylocella sp.]